MGFLNNTSVTVDAILTKKGRELLARGQNEFQITKFALADDEIDYNLWDTAHPNGSNYYGAVIENMPLLESFVDENQVMRFKLITLPKNTAKMPILEIPAPNLSFTGAGISQTISPNTRNGGDADGGYMFILHDATIANLTPFVGGKKKKFGKSKGKKKVSSYMKNLLQQANELGVTNNSISDLQVNSGATTPVFLNEEERKKSITLTGNKVNVVSRNITTETSTNLTIVGVDSGAIQNIVITVKPAPTS
mgnify:CR=1 FL=1